MNGGSATIKEADAVGGHLTGLTLVRGHANSYRIVDDQYWTLATMYCSVSGSQVVNFGGPVDRQVANACFDVRDSFSLCARTHTDPVTFVEPASREWHGLDIGCLLS